MPLTQNQISAQIKQAETDRATLVETTQHFPPGKQREDRVWEIGRLESVISYLRNKLEGVK